MKSVKNILFIFIFCFLLFTKSYCLENKILFKINNELITSVDLINEIEYLKILNKNLVKLEKEKIFEISKNSLIREKIKKIELIRLIDTLEVEKKYLNLLMDEFVKKANLENKKEFEKFIALKGIDQKTIEEKIKIEILWNQLIFTKFSQDVKIDKDKIKKNILKNNFQKEYLLSEIIFELNNEKLEKKFISIQNEIIENGFENAASLYSIAPTAKDGGKLGWIKFNSLNTKIQKEIKKTAKNNHTNPIVIPGGFLILKIEDEKKIDLVIDIEKEIELISNEIRNKQLNQFSNIYFNKLKKEVQINEY